MRRTHLFTLLLLLTAQVFDVVAQSGRKLPSQTPADPVTAEAAFAPDPNRDEYQLIFTEFSEAEKKERRRPLGNWDRREYYAQTFSDDLSRVGMQGYRLVSIASRPRLAVMRRAEHQYEYAIIQIANRQRLFPNDPKFELTFAPWAQKGFRVADYFVFRDWCEMATDNPIDQPSDLRVDCTYFSQVVLERRRDAEKMPAQRHGIVHVQPTFSKDKLETGLAEELNNARNTNLYPTHMITKFQLLAQSPADTDNPTVGDFEIEIIGGDAKKKINELAQRGYRLLVRPLVFDAAVMHRKKGTTASASYVWIGEKQLEQQLPALQEQGAIYRMSYGCRTGWVGGTQMIFEQPTASDGLRRQYKVLAIELKEGNNIAQELKRVAKEGFEVRDFFACHDGRKNKRPSSAKLLLERTVEDK
jgi:hypothetical protein